MHGESSRDDKPETIMQQHLHSKQQSKTLQELRMMTNDFSELLGEGAFGKVYKGVQKNEDGDKYIAVKKLIFNSTTPGIQDSQFENEVRLLMNLKHKNIVQLEGYCSETKGILVPHDRKYIFAEERERLLCFEYLSKGNLCGHLSDESCGHGWDTRYEIIKGICNGLHYLHGLSTPIIHMDLTPSNILLDDNMVPKIADFGLSKLYGEEQTRHSTKTCKGKLGYMSPEYLNNGMVSRALDIFSLGVIIIEMMTGKKEYPYGDETSSHQEFTELVLKNWIKRLEKTLGYAPREFDCHKIRRCIEIGLECVKHDSSKRPTMDKIIEEFQGFEGAECSNGREARRLPRKSNEDEPSSKETVSTADAQASDERVYDYYNPDDPIGINDPGYAPPGCSIV